MSLDYVRYNRNFEEMLMNLSGKLKAALTAAGALLALGVANAFAAEPKVGEKAPEFSLPGSDGKTYSLNKFKGKSAVVLAWFPKAFTGG
jgi:peroxiredoxin Q/BCP